MSLDKFTWLAVLLVVIGTAGTYQWRSDHGPPARAGTESSSDEQPGDEPEERDAPKPWIEPARKVHDDKTREEAARKAFFEAVKRVRAEQSGERPPGIQPGDQRADGLPIEMSFEQYRAWTKMAGALAKRDYQGVEAMVPTVESLFGPSMASAMLDAAVDDYAAYLESVLEARCDGWDAESVWRKTMFMTFALARLNRSSAALENRAKDVRQLCGYAA